LGFSIIWSRFIFCLKQYYGAAISFMSADIFFSFRAFEPLWSYICHGKRYVAIRLNLSLGSKQKGLRKWPKQIYFLYPYISLKILLSLGLRYLLTNCPSLRYLQIQGILGISAQFLKDTKTEFPHVEVDFFYAQRSRRNRGRNSDNAWNCC